MRFELLGPLRVTAGQQLMPITATRERILLATLLLHLDQPVPVDVLIDAIWDQHPPARARNQVQKCVWQLRARLGQDLLTTTPAGYRVRSEHATVDLPQFRDLVAAARIAVADQNQLLARDRYRAALALWRGPALADIDSPRVRRAAVSLDEERLRTHQECIEAELTLGGAGELVAELTDLVGCHPYQEDLYRALMLALFRAGRQADALATYQQARHVLTTELGQEPGPALKDLHQRILTGDAALLPTPTIAATTRPCALPRSLGDFTGRDHALTQLVSAGPRPGTVLAIHGMPGVGKTALAVQAAHLLTHHYPDAQLFIDLQGHSEHRPLAPAAALDRLLRQLGVPAARIPADPDERVTQWRTELANRRVLVVLDNAASTSQVTPLLPTGRECLTLVTSRHRLVGLDGAHPVPLAVLSEPEAVALLTQIAGDRVPKDPAAAREVVRRCGALPLAIRLAAARLAHRPSWTIKDLRDRLRDGQVLDQLTAEDRTAASIFALSYHPLHPDQQRVFRLLALHPGEHFDSHATAALADIAPAEAEKSLDELADRQLLQEHDHGRYRFHDLLREYAHQQVLSTDSDSDRRCAIERLLDYYLRATITATATIDPSYLRQLGFDATPVGDVGIEPPRLDVAWLELERPNLTLVVGHANAWGMDRYSWRLAQACWPFLYESSYLDDLFTTHRSGLVAARRLGDREAEACMLNYLASAHYGVGDFTGAIATLQRAADLRASLGDESGAAASRMNLAELHHQCGDLHYAATLHADILHVRYALGDRSRIANSLCNLGLLQTKLAQYDAANRTLRASLLLSRETGNQAAYSRSLGHLGNLRVRLGQHRLAMNHLRAALRAKCDAGNRKGHAEVLSDLAAAYRGLGQFDAALAQHQTALTEVAEIGDRPTECQVRNEYGRTLLATGDTAGALAQHQAARQLAAKIRLKYEHAKALDGIGHCLRQADPGAARRHWQEALTLYSEMDIPEQHQIAHLLTELPAAPATGITPTGP